MTKIPYNLEEVKSGKIWPGRSKVLVQILPEDSLSELIEVVQAKDRREIRRAILLGVGIDVLKSTFPTLSLEEITGQTCLLLYRPMDRQWNSFETLDKIGLAILDSERILCLLNE